MKSFNSLLILFIFSLLLSACAKEEDADPVLSASDRLWAPYSVGEILTYVSDDGVELEAKVQEVISTANIHTNVIDLGEIGMLHIEVIAKLSGSWVEQYLTFEGFESEPLPGFVFQTNIAKEENQAFLGLTKSLIKVELAGESFDNVCESRVRVEDNGILVTYLTKDRGMIGFDDVHDSGIWILK